jgi:uridine kinase
MKRVQGFNAGAALVTENAKRLLRIKKGVIIGVSGGSGSGKTRFARFVARKLGAKTISMDDYYVGIDRMKSMNFDHPSSIDMALLGKHLSLLGSGRPINKPVYDFSAHRRKGYEKYRPSGIIVVEGIFALHSRIADKIDIAVFVEASERTRLARRMRRDIRERRRTKYSVKRQWKETVQPMYIRYVKSGMKRADIVLVNE